MANETEKLIKARKRQFAGETAASLIAAGTLGGVVGYTEEKMIGDICSLMDIKAKQKILQVSEDSSLSNEEKLKKVESIQKKNNAVKIVTTVVGRGTMVIGSYCIGQVIGQQLITKKREMNYDIAKIVSKSKSKESK